MKSVPNPRLLQAWDNQRELPIIGTRSISFPEAVAHRAIDEQSNIVVSPRIRSFGLGFARGWDEARLALFAEIHTFLTAAATATDDIEQTATWLEVQRQIKSIFSQHSAYISAANAEQEAA